ncbi:MAG: hypothetical protein JO183_11280 [Ktedonobacteraceae bacterium]|nr:hypothetical protein [Ktedonobacteraceae bacterium]
MDRSQRRAYRKSPGRQYGYEYDPLRSRTGSHQRDTTQELHTQLIQRPDPRRTRQLLRQHIIAGKAHLDNEAESSIEQQPVRQRQQFLEQQELDDVVQQLSLNPRTHNVRIPQVHTPSTDKLMHSDEGEDDWSDYEDRDTDADYDDFTDLRRTPSALKPYRSTTLPPATPLASATLSSESSIRQPEVEEYVDDDDEYDDYEDDQPSTGRSRKKRKVSRRGLLVGLGAVAVAGAGVAAYEFGPKVVGNVGADIEHQLQDAFNKGLAQGADAVRKDFITSLESLEGFTLASAQTAALLTRRAYDVFVSPIVKFGSTLAADFLGVMLQAFRSGRHILAVVNQDNATLAAIQSVLEIWVAQVSSLPKQLDTITQTDLDGAQAYLRALQRKLDEEKAKLNNNGKTSTPGKA